MPPISVVGNCTVAVLCNLHESTGGLVANGLFPVNADSPVSTVLSNRRWQQNISRISPQHCITSSGNHVNPESEHWDRFWCRSMEYTDHPGTERSACKPHNRTHCTDHDMFAISYIYFMRQEIRA